MMDIVALLGLLLAALGLAFQRGWLPPKHRMADASALRDPKAEAIFGPASTFDHSPRASRVVAPHMVPKYKADGFRPVRIAFGHEFPLGRLCVWTGKVSDGSIQECVLMARPLGAEGGPNPAPAGREPVYAAGLDDLPEGLPTDRVSWMRENQLAGRVKVLDNAGREWRVRDPGGDLLLVYKR